MSVVGNRMIFKTGWDFNANSGLYKLFWTLIYPLQLYSGVHIAFSLQKTHKNAFAQWRFPCASMRVSLFPPTISFIMYHLPWYLHSICNCTPMQKCNWILPTSFRNSHTSYLRTIGSAPLPPRLQSLLLMNLISECAS